ncbi:spore germination protein [Anaerobacillus sp. HL2]|nr:spore germination protein [Anaerobacillus sp. HL2]
MPKPIGQAVSIVGALILGQAARCWVSRNPCSGCCCFSRDSSISN